MNIDINNINNSATLLFSCMGSGGDSDNETIYTINSSNYYRCPLCYQLSDTGYTLKINASLNTIPDRKALINNISNDVVGITGSQNNYSWTLSTSYSGTNQILTIWTHMYNLLLQQLNNIPLTLFPVYLNTIQHLTKKYIDNLNYKCITPTVAMLYGQSKMFSVLNTSNSKKINRNDTNKLKQKNVKIVIDDNYDYLLVPYQSNPIIQPNNTQQFVVTKTLQRFMELFYLTLINSNYNLSWIQYKNNIISDKLDSSSLPININNIVYHMNDKSVKCLINFLTSFGILTT